MDLHSLHLHTPDPALLAGFYGMTLGLPTRLQEDGSLAVTIGASQVTWSRGEQAYYHFAINVPHDLVEAAGAWLAARGIALLPFEGNRIVPFPNWDAHAVYFHDPVGNIVEFIGRRRLGLAGKPDFEVGDIWAVSEMGVPAYEFGALGKLLSGEAEPSWAGLPVFGGSTDYFCAFGDDRGLFITVDAAVKKWIPAMEPALPFPFRVQARHGGQSFSLFQEDGKLVLSLD